MVGRDVKKTAAANGQNNRSLKPTLTKMRNILYFRSKTTIGLGGQKLARMEKVLTSNGPPMEISQGGILDAALEKFLKTIF